MTIDCRNLGCPEPVIQTKKALECGSEATLTVIVNAAAAIENVSRFAQSQGCETSVEDKGDHHAIVITKGANCANLVGASGRAMFITRDAIGEGELGAKLIAGFIKTLIDEPVLPEKIIFVNRGVLLTTQNEATIASLKTLETKGVQIFSCGTCLEHFNLASDLKVGKIGNAYETLANLLGAQNTITL